QRLSALPFFETGKNALENRKLELILFLLFGRPRLLELILETLDTTRDDFQVGEEHFLAETPQFVAKVAARRTVQHDQETAGVAYDAQAAWIVSALSRQKPRGIEKFDLGRRGFLGLKMGRKPIESLVTNDALPDLTVLALGRVGRGARQPMEHRALARSRESRNADFHSVRVL